MVRQKRIHSRLRSLPSHCRFAFRQTRKSPGARDLVAHRRFPKNLAKTLPQALEVAGRSFARECEFSQLLDARGNIVNANGGKC